MSKRTRKRDLTEGDVAFVSKTYVGRVEVTSPTSFEALVDVEFYSTGIFKGLAVGNGGFDGDMVLGWESNDTEKLLSREMEASDCFIWLLKRQLQTEHEVEGQQVQGGGLEQQQQQQQEEQQEEQQVQREGQGQQQEQQVRTGGQDQQQNEQQEGEQEQQVQEGGQEQQQIELQEGQGQLPEEQQEQQVRDVVVLIPEAFAARVSTYDVPFGLTTLVDAVKDSRNQKGLAQREC